MARRGRPRKPTPVAEETSTLLDTLQNVSRMVAEGDKEMLAIALATPDKAADMAKKLLDDWEDSGAAAIFQSQDNMAKYYQAAMLGIFVRYVHILTKSLDLLDAKLDNPDMGPPQYLALAERLRDQVLSTQEQLTKVRRPSQMPADEEELNRRLADARRELGEDRTIQ